MLKAGDEGFQQMYSMSLTALASGKRMQCWFRDCAVSTWGGKTLPRIYACGLLAE